MTAENRLAELLETVDAPSNRGRLTHDWIAEELGHEALLIENETELAE